MNYSERVKLLKGILEIRFGVWTEMRVLLAVLHEKLNAVSIDHDVPAAAFVYKRSRLKFGSDFHQNILFDS